MADPNANLAVIAYRTGNISAQQFIDEMRGLNYSTQQIVQIMNAVNSPNAPRQIPLPEPSGNVLPPEAYRRPDASSSFSTTTPGPGQTTPLVLPPAAAAPTATPSPAPSVTPPVTPEAVQIAREATARSDEGPTYGRSESALLQVPRSEEGPWYGRPEPMVRPTPAQRAVQAARQTVPLPPSRPEDLSGQGSSGGPSGLMQFIRGDFREGADQRVMDAMRRQREESGLTEERARGGQVESKKTSRDDVLHKALDIIHAMMMRR